MPPGPARPHGWPKADAFTSRSGPVSRACSALVSDPVGKTRAGPRLPAFRAHSGPGTLDSLEQTRKFAGRYRPFPGTPSDGGRAAGRCAGACSPGHALSALSSTTAWRALGIPTGPARFPGPAGRGLVSHSPPAGGMALVSRGGSSRAWAGGPAGSPGGNGWQRLAARQRETASPPGRSRRR